MNIYIKNIIIICSFIIVGDITYAATSRDETISLLQEYWIDKDGSTRIGDKDAASLQFSFSKNLLDKMSDAQLRSSMNVAIARFTKEQQEAFKNVVIPLLDELKQGALNLVNEKKEMEDLAASLSKDLRKSPPDIMRLAEENIRNLVSQLPQDKKIAIGTAGTMTKFFTLRKKLNPEVVEARSGSRDEDRYEDSGKAPKEGSSVKTKVADAVANTNFKLSSMSGFVGTALGYGMCRNRHWDILLDSQGHHFMSEAKP
jgi:hypothetical protein